ncbi:MAG TPA: DNA polymerase III subunit delta [Bacteroidetes bacterium]|nr:DNA polymerase III subunit delta [Bacteroidota bacterium]
MPKDGLTIDDLRSALAQRKFAPAYLFHGEEGFLAEEATDLIIRTALSAEQQGFNLDVLYGSDADARDIISHASSFPMVAERRVVVVREVDKLVNKELLSSYLEQPSASTCLILHSTKPDFRKKPYATAKRTATVIRFEPIRDNQITGWINARVKQQGRQIDLEAAKILAAYAGTSLREIQNELDKLYSFAGEKTTISSDDIRAVVGVSRDFNIFELQNAIGAKNLSRSTEILSRMLDGGESPVFIIVMLTRFFTTLWKLSDFRRRGTTDLAGAVGVNPHFIKDYVAALGNFPASELEHSFEVLATADEQLKSTSLDPFQIMQNMILYLMKQRELALT